MTAHTLEEALKVFLRTEDAEEPCTWTWTGPTPSLRQSGISERRARAYARTIGGTAQKI